MTDIIRVTLDITPKEGKLEDLMKILTDPDLLKRLASHATATEVGTSRVAMVVATPAGGFAHIHMDPNENGPCETCKSLARVDVYKVFS